MKLWCWWENFCFSKSFFFLFIKQRNHWISMRQICDISHVDNDQTRPIWESRVTECFLNLNYWLMVFNKTNQNTKIQFSWSRKINKWDEICIVHLWNMNVISPSYTSKFSKNIFVDAIMCLHNILWQHYTQMSLILKFSILKNTERCNIW